MGEQLNRQPNPDNLHTRLGELLSQTDLPVIYEEEQWHGIPRYENVEGLVAANGLWHLAPLQPITTIDAYRVFAGQIYARLQGLQGESTTVGDLELPKVEYYAADDVRLTLGSFSIHQELLPHMFANAEIVIHPNRDVATGYKNAAHLQEKDLPIRVVSERQLQLNDATWFVIPPPSQQELEEFRGERASFLSAVSRWTRRAFGTSA